MGNDYCVLLCTHDGAAYLPEQLDSLALQTVRPALVLAFDDGSSDGTVEVLERYRDKLPLQLVRLRKSRPGAAGAFAAILQYARECETAFPAYFLCDQDDRWVSNKAERLLGGLASAGATPTLVHGELHCFGDPAFAGRKLHDFLGHVRLESSTSSPLTSVVLENMVVGASAALNRELLELATPVPGVAYMHDWWLAIACVAAGGTLKYFREPLTEYRIHARSTLGRSGTAAHAWSVRARALSRGGWRDPWLRTVLEQLAQLPLDQAGLDAKRLGTVYAAGLELARARSLRRRWKAWCSIAAHRVWAVGVKDAYYKGRLLTDVVFGGVGDAR